MARKLEDDRLQTAQGVQTGLEHLYREARVYREARPAELSVAAPAIRAADLAHRETWFFLGEGEIDARLVVRNIAVDGRRTSVRLEDDMWQALCDIARRHQTSVNRICSLVDKRRGGSSLTAALRAFALRYFRVAARAAEDGAMDRPDANPACAGYQRGPV